MRGHFFEVLEIELSGLPDPFTSAELESRAETVVADLTGLLRLDERLANSQVSHSFRPACKDGQAVIQVLIGLAPSVQLRLAFHEKAPAVQRFIQDCDTMVDACRNVHQQELESTLGYAHRVRQACLDMAPAELESAARRWLKDLSRIRRLPANACMSDRKIRLPQPSRLPVEWQHLVSTLRVRVHREKQGYSLKVLHDGVTPDSRAVIRLPEYPARHEDRARLDELCHTGLCVNLRIRLGKSDLVSVWDDVGDFVEFA
jgi:hypothetical protein